MTVTTSTAKYVSFNLQERLPGRKTDVWVVIPRDGTRDIGAVGWYGRWRCYAFFPSRDTVFEKTCLRDIATFCEHQTQIQRRTWR